MAARRPFRLRTERFTIRPLGRDDVTRFTSYRTSPDVARYQDWPMPYTRDLAHALVDDMERLGGPTPGEWVQLAIDPGDGLIGDVAVWLDDAGTLAMIGYTLASEHQGHGYATEAVAAVVDWLFRRRNVHRVAATIDPRNLASARVLERCGFEYVGTARSAALARGEWSDDARFSLLRPDWTAWRERPTAPPSDVRLVEVTADNVRSVGAIERTFSQRELVAPVLVSLAEALVPPTVRGTEITPWFRAIEADGDVTGFVMMAEPRDGSEDPYLWRLVIDQRHQGRGIGRRAIAQIIAERRSAGHAGITVSYVGDAVGSPAGFYERLGFVPTGRIDDGETEARLNLST
ncbi:GNAT family N-acetyltransferase [Ilumatobacter sp.]|uniref:GNAT family N-acetyltransferase n=1 Tax=Ilumatobacter sp. TaxID=1967498 RepID=UPI003AF77D54